jgi:hypothetical protein
MNRSRKPIICVVPATIVPEQNVSFQSTHPRLTSPKQLQIQMAFAPALHEKGDGVGEGRDLEWIPLEVHHKHAFKFARMLA